MLEKKQVEGAVDAILTLLESKTDAVSIVDHPKKIDLQFTLKQIPKLKHKIIPVDLPVSIHYELREVCIFVKDLDQKTREYEATVQHYEALFSKHKIQTVTKIVPIKALRTDYSLSSSKISLAKAYELYLADSRIKGLLPGILGKIFYAKKRTVPVQVNLGVKDLKKEIDRAVNNTRCEIKGSGSSCLVTVAHDRMDKEQITSNVLAACEQLMKQVPGGKNNIRNLYVKSSDTTAVPLYIDIESANNVKLPSVKTVKMPTYIDEITTVENGQVMITADGHVQIIRKKDEREASKANRKDKKEKKVSKDSGKGKVTDEKQKEEIIEHDTDSDDADNNDDVKAKTNAANKTTKGNKKKGNKKNEVIIGEGHVSKGQKQDEKVHDLNDGESTGSDNDSKDNAQVEITDRKKSLKGDKGQRKRKSVEKEDIHVEKKKAKQNEIVNVKQGQKLKKKGKKKSGK